MARIRAQQRQQQAVGGQQQIRGMMQQIPPALLVNSTASSTQTTSKKKVGRARSVSVLRGSVMSSRQAFEPPTPAATGSRVRGAVTSEMVSPAFVRSGSVRSLRQETARRIGGDSGPAAVMTTTARAQGSGREATLLQGMERRAQSLSARIRSISVGRARQPLAMDGTPSMLTQSTSCARDRLSSRESASSSLSSRSGGVVIGTVSTTTKPTRESRARGVVSNDDMIAARGSGISEIGGSTSSSSSLLRLEMIKAVGADRRRQRHFHRQAKVFVSVWDVLCEASDIFEKQQRASSSLRRDANARTSASSSSSTTESDAASSSTAVAARGGVAQRGHMTAVQRLVESAVNRGNDIDREVLALLHPSLPDIWYDSLIDGYRAWARVESSLSDRSSAAATTAAAAAAAAAPTDSVTTGPAADIQRRMAVKQIRRFFNFYASNCERIQAMLGMLLREQGGSSAAALQRQQRANARPLSVNPPISPPPSVPQPQPKSGT